MSYMKHEGVDWSKRELGKRGVRGEKNWEGGENWEILCVLL